MPMPMIESFVLLLILTGSDGASSKGDGEMWVVPSATYCELAKADAIERGHASAGRCLPALIDLEAWASVAARKEIAP